MNIENIAAAAKAAEDYQRASSDLAFVRDKCVYFSRPQASPTSTVASSDVYEDMDGLSGQLASDIRCAMIRYHEGHLKLAEDKLHKLGIEIPDSSAKAVA